MHLKPSYFCEKKVTHNSCLCLLFEKSTAGAVMSSTVSREQVDLLCLLLFYCPLITKTDTIIKLDTTIYI